MYKYELADLAGVSTRCITELCKQYEQEMQLLCPTYRRSSKLLPPILVAFLKEKYVIT